jgi:small redox-active disulfide protein 2
MKKIQILGTGCPKCKQLAQCAQQAANELAIPYEIEKVTQINDIMKFGVMITPALVVDGKVQSVGKVLTLDEMKRFLQ